MNRRMDDSSWNNSGITFDVPTGFVDQEESSSLGAIVEEPMPIEWTDEKHSLYITSMEAAFVEQLYNSKNSFGWCPQTNHGPDVKACGQGNPRQVKHSRRPDPQPEAYGHDHLANARSKHFRVRGKRDVASSSVQDNDFFTHQRLSYEGQLSYYSGSRNRSTHFTEVSDQNFADQGCESELQKGSWSLASCNQVLDCFVNSRARWGRQGNT